MSEKKPYPVCESSCNTCRNDHLGCRADKGAIIIDEELEKKIEDAQFSACKTCTRKLCDCGRSYYDKIQIIERLMDEVEEGEFEYHINTDYVQLIHYNCKTFDIELRVLDRIHDVFIVLCAFIALSFNRVIDFVLEGFEKAFRSGRL